MQLDLLGIVESSCSASSELSLLIVQELMSIYLSVCLSVCLSFLLQGSGNRARQRLVGESCGHELSSPQGTVKEPITCLFPKNKKEKENVELHWLI
jgi:hypothetical protein